MINIRKLVIYMQKFSIKKGVAYKSLALLKDIVWYKKSSNMMHFKLEN